MNKKQHQIRLTGIFVLFLVIIGTVAITSAADIYTGKGKPQSVDIYINDIPYGASLGGEVQSGTGTKSVNDFRAIVDDEQHPDPSYYVEASNPSTEGPTPTPTPIPVATTVIPIDKGGVGSTLCVTDNTSEIIVDFAFSDAWYKSVYSLSSPNNIAIGDSKSAYSGGTTRKSLGNFSIGTELKFADAVYDGSTYKGTYYTGSASRNPDDYVHAAITLKNETGTHFKYLVSFEDASGGGDNDFNDVEFYVSGGVSTKCSSTGGAGSLIPESVDVCKCNSSYNKGNQRTCIALFTYRNVAGVQYEIPINGKSLPWNEFTGSGMVGKSRCQPELFYVTESKNSPFWTTRFWNNIKWKLGYDKSVLVKCDSGTRDCTSAEMPNCTSCTG
nr:DUF4114 domain-containing protein [uncultured Methanospirillum sp.]